MDNFETVEYDECTLEERFDGIVIRSYSWKVFKDSLDLILARDIIVQKVYKNTFKGLTLNTETSDFIKVFFGKLANQTVALLVELKSDNLDFGYIAGRIKRYSDMAKNEINNTYDRVINRANVKRFAKKFVRESSTYFKSSYNVESFQIVISEFGQDKPIFTLDSVIQNFSLEVVTELVVHHAVDLYLPQNILIWNRQKLMKHMKGHRLTQSYPVALIGGLANCYYEFKESDEEEDSVAVELISVKFYSELFKTTHRVNTGSLPFQHSTIADALFSPKEFSPGFCYRYTKNWSSELEKILRVKQDIEKVDGSSDTYYARIEAIVKFNEPVGGNVVNNVRTYVRELDCLNPQRLLLRRESCLVKIRTTDIRNHLNINVATLETYVRNRMNALPTRIMEDFSFGDYQLAAGCELIICFALYGNTSFRNGRYSKFNEKIKKALGVDRYDFNRFEENKQLGMWVFPQVVRHGQQLQFMALNLGVSETLAQIAKFSKIESDNLENLNKIAKVDEMFHNLDCGLLEEEDDEYNTVINEAAAAIINFQTTAALFTDNRRPRNSNIEIYGELRRICRTRKGRKKLLLGRQFVERLFRLSETIAVSGNSFVEWLMRIVVRIFDGRPEHLFRLITSVILQLDHQLLKWGGILAIPTQKDGIAYVIPSNGDRQFNFKSLMPHESLEFEKNISHVASNRRINVSKEAVHDVYNQSFVQFPKSTRHLLQALIDNTR